MDNKLLFDTKLIDTKLDLMIDCLKFIPSDTGGTAIMDVEAKPGGYLGCVTVEIWRPKNVCGEVIKNSHLNIAFPDSIYPEKYFRETFKRALLAAAGPYKKAIQEGRCPSCKNSSK